MTPRLAVVIPTFNNFDLTRRSLAALREHGADVPHEVVVVDNASSDGTPQRIAHEFPRVRVIANDVNAGYGEACNQGWRASDAPVVLFLNNDAFAHAGALEALARAFDDPAVGVAGARCLFADGTIQHAGMVFLRDGTPYHVHVNLEGDLPDALIARDYVSVTGAALAARRELLEALGGFDAAYRNGFEDLDLNLRAWDAGWRVRYVPASVFTHLESQTPGRHDYTPQNAQTFYGRWGARLASLTAYPLPPLPALGIHGDLTAPTVEAQAARQFVAALRAWNAPLRAFGAVRDELAALAHAAFEPEVDLLLSGASAPPGRPRVRLAAPVNTAEARALLDPAAIAYLVPTAAAHALMHAAGAPPALVHRITLGIDANVFSPAATPLAIRADGVRNLGVPITAATPPGTAALALAAAADASRVAGPIRLIAITDLPLELVASDLRAAAARLVGPFFVDGQILSSVGARETMLPGMLTALDAWLAPMPGDRYEFMTAAALAVGLPLVRLGPADELVSDATATIADGAGFVAALTTALTAPDMTRRAFARTMMLRQYSAFFAGRRTAEVIRAAARGVASGETAAMTPERAELFRASRYATPGSA